MNRPLKFWQQTLSGSFNIDHSFELRDVLSVMGHDSKAAPQECLEQSNSVSIKGKIINIHLENSDVSQVKQFSIVKNLFYRAYIMLLCTLHLREIMMHNISQTDFPGIYLTWSISGRLELSKKYFGNATWKAHEFQKKKKMECFISIPDSVARNTN